MKRAYKGLGVVVLWCTVAAYTGPMRLIAGLIPKRWLHL